MSYCRLHNCNNCMECAINRSTTTIVAAIEAQTEKLIEVRRGQPQEHDHYGDISSTNARRVAAKKKALKPSSWWKAWWLQ